MTTITRRYDIDWIRVIAIGLLLIYHTAIAFQPWGIMIGFITNDKPLPSLWSAMAMLNVWRIPILFFISGMGVYFAMQNRNWKQLITERAKRIFVPFVVGFFTIVPLSTYLLLRYYGNVPGYHPNPGHLWFLGNIFAYVILLSPFFFYLLKNGNGKMAVWIRKSLNSHFGILIVITAFIIEAILVKPKPYELYAMTAHGFFLGLLGFFFGFCFMFCGASFWKNLLKMKWLFFATAVSLYAYRLFQPMMIVSDIDLVIESNCWIFSVFAFGYRYLNFNNSALRYLSQAAYPVYIIHMVVLYLACWFIFPLNIGATIKFVVLLATTLIGCLFLYELFIRRVKFIRPLFGLKHRRKEIRENIPAFEQAM